MQNDFDVTLKNFQITKKFFENPLVKKKRQMRVILIEHALLQHESRTENTKKCLTKTHKMIMINLLELSCSHYSKVKNVLERKKERKKRKNLFLFHLNEKKKILKLFGICNVGFVISFYSTFEFYF